MDYPTLVDRMLGAALRRYGSRIPKQGDQARIELGTGSVELSVPAGVHFPPPSSIDLARILDVKPGDQVLDLGCGSGLLTIAAAKLGAKRVVATDMDPLALDIPMVNAQRNGVAERVEARAGSWYGALGGETEKFDVILATPPQTPAPWPFGPKYGGFDGMKHLQTVLDGASFFLNPATGRLWLLALSLANPSALWKSLHEIFDEVSLVKETERPFTTREYEELAKGLFHHFLTLRSLGKAEFKEMEGGRYAFRNLFIRAKGIRKR